MEDSDLAALHRASLDHALRTIEIQMEDEDLRAFVEAEKVEDVAAE